MYISVDNAIKSRSCKGSGSGGRLVLHSECCSCVSLAEKAWV